jgi:hypothetical protein
LASPISNFVTLVPGVPVKLHFKDHAIQKRVITDPIRRVQVERESLMLYVDKENSTPCDKVLSILSQKLAADFAGYLPGKSYTRYEFVLIKDAAGTVPPRIVSVAPL